MPQKVKYALFHLKLQLGISRWNTSMIVGKRINIYKHIYIYISIHAYIYLLPYVYIYESNNILQNVSSKSSLIYAQQIVNSPKHETCAATCILRMQINHTSIRDWPKDCHRFQHTYIVSCLWPLFVADDGVLQASSDTELASIANINTSLCVHAMASRTKSVANGHLIAIAQTQRLVLSKSSRIKYLYHTYI